MTFDYLRQQGLQGFKDIWPKPTVLQLVEGPISPMGNPPVYKAIGLAVYEVTLITYISLWCNSCYYPLLAVVIFQVWSTQSFSSVCSFGINFLIPDFWKLCFLYLLIHKSEVTWHLLLLIQGRRAMQLLIFTRRIQELAYGEYRSWHKGMELYPRIGKNFDVKVFTNCRFGMMSLGSSCCDISYQAAGFYICWGCLVWVPSIYPSPGMYLVNLGTQIVASYQTGNGETKTSLLLTSGWWGLARHFHYVPEILSAFFWTVTALFIHSLPYFYVVFLTILLFDQAKRDDDCCRSKYEKYWKLYCDKVPYRVVPSIY
ncbi:hypothetical protein IFM89_029080 [Coptis chinensis]|uniref:7-dehydrocholesterol reductase n=1 Tax=Coptis chinensis TaxID=261450 RepID=A0A835IFQ1_9MAGN|nr:hypothetical protein IFM89_029080 [Coptis chinensis]